LRFFLDLCVGHYVLSCPFSLSCIVLVSLSDPGCVVHRTLLLTPPSFLFRVLSIPFLLSPTHTWAGLSSLPPTSFHGLHACPETTLHIPPHPPLYTPIYLYPPRYLLFDSRRLNILYMQHLRIYSQRSFVRLISFGLFQQFGYISIYFSCLFLSHLLNMLAHIYEILVPFFSAALLLLLLLLIAFCRCIVSLFG